MANTRILRLHAVRTASLKESIKDVTTLLYMYIEFLKLTNQALQLQYELYYDARKSVFKCELNSSEDMNIQRYIYIRKTISIFKTEMCL